MTLATTGPTEGRRYKAKDPRTGRVVGTGAEFRHVPVGAMRLDSAYQRDLRQSDVARMAAAWSPHKAGVVVLSERHGGPFIIDGQHRVAAAREAGITQLPAMVIEGLTQADEARLFVAYQEERRGHTAIGKFKANTVAQDPVTVDIITAVNRAGYIVSPRTADNHITAINALIRVHRLGGVELVSGVLQLVRSMWFGERKATDGQVLYGLALFLNDCGHRPQFKAERLERIMADYAPTRLLRKAQDVGDERGAISMSSANVAEALVRIYDDGERDPKRRLGVLHIGKKRRPAPAKR